MNLSPIVTKLMIAEKEIKEYIYRELNLYEFKIESEFEYIDNRYINDNKDNKIKLRYSLTIVSEHFINHNFSNFIDHCLKNCDINFTKKLITNGIRISYWTQTIR